MLKILVGGVGEGKSARVFAEMKAALGLRPLILIVPEQYVAEAEREVLTRLGVSGFGLGNLDVTTPSRLFQRVEQELIKAEKPKLSEQVSRIALHGAITALGSGLTTLESGAKQPGFLPLATRLLGQFRLAGLSPEELSVASEHVGNPLLKGRLADLSLLFERHRGLIEGRFADEEDVYSAFSGAMPQAKFLHDALIWVDRFDVLSRAMSGWLAALSNFAQVTVVVNLEEGNPAYLPMENAVKRLERAASEAGVKHERVPVRPGEGDARSDALSHLTRHLLLSPPAIYSKESDSIAIERFPDADAEVSACARRIAAVVRDEGWRYRDVAVVCGDIAKYAPLVEYHFGRSGLPYFIDQKRPALCHPCARALLSALEAAVTGFSYDSMLACLESGYSGVSDGEAALLRQAAEERDLRGKWWNFALKGEYETAEPFREAFMGPLNALKRRLSTVDTARELVQSAFGYLEDTGAYLRLQNDVNALAENGFVVEAQESSQMWQLLLDALDAIVDVLGDSIMTAPQLFPLLEAALSASEVGVLPPAPDTVLVSTIDRLKTPPLKAVFVLGVAEGTFPKLPPQGLLTDEELSETALNIENPNVSSLMPTRIEAQALLNLRLLSVLARPTHKIYFSVPLADENGKALTPPALLDSLARTFPNSVKAANEGLAEDAVQTRGDVLPFAISLGDNAEVYSRDEGAAGVVSWVLSQPDLAAKYRAAKALRRPVTQPPLGEKMAARLYPKDSLWVTQLEQFARCPWKHFVEYALKRRRPREPYPSRLDIGDRMHKVVELGLTRLIDLDPLSVTRQLTDEWANQGAYEALADWRDFPAAGLGRMEFIRRRVAETSQRALYAALLQFQAGTFRPIAMESDFHSDGLRGVIDRVDKLNLPQGDFLRVIDYKSGAQQLKLNEVLAGVRLQLPLYIRAAGNQFGGVPAGMYYFSMADKLAKARLTANESPQDGIMRSFRLVGWSLNDADALRGHDAEESGNVISSLVRNKDNTWRKTAQLASAAAWDGLLAKAGALAQSMGSEIRGGEISPKPLRIEKLACEQCDAIACHFALQPGASVRNVLKRKNEEILAELEEIF